MHIQSRLFSETLAAIFLGTVLFTGVTDARGLSHPRQIVVVPPASLPAPAREQGVALQLYSESGDGRCYLYIEQRQGERLLVLDVTDPAHVKVAGSVALTVPGPFDFVRSLGSSAILVRFHNNLGMAVLDLRKPKTPALKPVSALRNLGQTESLGSSALLVADDRSTETQAIPQDYRVIDTSNPDNLALLFTVKQVNDKTSCGETGATFLLGSEGLTIIRRPQSEDNFRSEQRNN